MPWVGARIGAGCLGLALMGCPAPSPSPPSETALIEVTGPELVERVRSRGARFVVLNVWATWCGPCREEFPYVQKVTRGYRDRGVDLIFVSTDFETEREAAVAFLREQGAELPSFVKTGDDQVFIDALAPTWTGSLPFTVIFDARGRRVKAWEGQVEEAELASALARLVRASES